MPPNMWKQYIKYLQTVISVPGREKEANAKATLMTLNADTDRNVGTRTRGAVTSTSRSEKKPTAHRNDLRNTKISSNKLQLWKREEWLSPKRC